MRKTRVKTESASLLAVWQLLPAPTRPKAKRPRNSPHLSHLARKRSVSCILGHVLHQTLDPCLVARRQEHRLIDAETAVLRTSHVLDDFWLDLVLGQIKGKDRFLPGCLQPLQVELGQLRGWHIAQGANCSSYGSNRTSASASERITRSEWRIACPSGVITQSFFV
jgi:hypothetical protein